jgi:hypothetical protein
MSKNVYPSFNDILSGSGRHPNSERRGVLPGVSMAKSLTIAAASFIIYTYGRESMHDIMIHKAEVSDSERRCVFSSLALL